jgi:hypothetical protein
VASELVYITSVRPRTLQNGHSTYEELLLSCSNGTGLFRGAGWASFSLGAFAFSTSISGETVLTSMGCWLGIDILK